MNDPAASLRDSPQRPWQLIAGLSGGVGVTAAALGAHAVPDPALVKLVETASEYQLIHAAVLLWLASSPRRGLSWARWLFLVGTLLFCGTLYLKAFAILPGAVALAPWGGTSFILGWLVLAVDALL
ncbi:MAG TPA: DUF423 domain-containing protein [Alphaproteobacteria bacterium]|nr:DUF423 domain-containing protein [Alphaproteobacteria bacterium]